MKKKEARISKTKEAKEKTKEKIEILKLKDESSPSLEFKITPIKRKKIPSLGQWKKFFKILNKKEKIIFFGSLFLFVFSFIFLLTSLYLKNTQTTPAYGGTFVEGVLSHPQPRFINPIYANSDIDRDLTELIFSGLMKYSEDMEIIPELAQSYPEIEDEGKIYKFYLKENLVWQDNKPLTADDVVFTIKTIQNPDFKSPYLANWVGVKVEKINDLAVKFTLQKAYAGFMENCAIKILPKHILEKVVAENFPFTPHNLEQAIGSGPFKIKEIKRNDDGEIKNLILERNNLYFGKKPYLEKIKFVFYKTAEELFKAIKSEKIQGLSLSSSVKNLNYNKWQENIISLPKYFAIFFNQENSDILADKNIRLALSYATNKEEFSQKIIHSPLLPEFYNFENPSETYEFNLEKAKQILEESKFYIDESTGIRKKTVKQSSDSTFKTRLVTGSEGKEVTELQNCLAKFYPETQITGYFGSKTKELVINFQEEYKKEILEPSGLSAGNGVVGPATQKKLNEVCFDGPIEFLELKITLTTLDQDQMIEIAEKIKKQWEAVGVKVEIEKYPIFDLESEFIKPRNYEALLFGNVLSAVPDPFPFWHSSQSKDPGFNLSSYNNKNADDLMEEIRKTSENEERKQMLEQLQEIIIKDIPAVFLYSQDYSYLISKKVFGVFDIKTTDSSKRFLNIENWYIKVKRVLK